MSRRGERRGPIGGLFGLIGQGVGMAAEYNEHRREQNQLRNAAQQQEPVELPGDTAHPQRQERPAPATTSDLPPAYSESADRSEISLGAGQRLSANEKGAIPRDDELSDPNLSDDDSDSLLSVGDDTDWELDELEEMDGISQASDTTNLPSYDESQAMNQSETVDDLVRQVVETSRRQVEVEDAQQQQQKVEQPRAQLPCPVILPQRRPRKKQRGFVRAYAPLLGDCGIDQDTFMAFLKSLHKSSQASPVFPVIQVSAAIAGFAPSVIAMAVTTAVQIAAGVGAEVQTRARTNNFLDRMNEELFKPAGLYAMIVKYKSDAEVEQAASGVPGLLSSLIRAEKVDLTTNQVIAKYDRAVPDASRGLSERLQGLRLASDNTKGTAQMPMAAPLIYPDLDKKVALDGPESFKDKTKDAQKFLADYLDRRAQMQYAMQDPKSALAVPESQRAFKSSLADPNHPMNSGGLIALASGGKLTPRLDKHERRREKRLDKDVRRFERGREPREGKRARRYGDDYVDDLHSRINERLAGHRARLENITGRPSLATRLSERRQSRQGGLVGGLIRTISDTSSEHGSMSKAPVASGSSSGLSRDEDKYSARRGFADSPSGESSSRDPHGLRHRRKGLRREIRDRRRQGGALGMVKRVMREDVLYLMIVNMPSEAELAEAREELGLVQDHGREQIWDSGN